MYRDKLDEIMYSVNSKAISTKILQCMAKIRNNDDEGQARRFVWELIQNAKDVAQEGIPLSIRVRYERDRLVFAHNGKSFLLRNILSLINQVSGKSDDSKTTGKFGTGFVATHLLAEKVTVRGVLEDFGLEPKRFEVLIDRSGRDESEVISAVDKAMESLRSIDDSPAAEYLPAALNTEFEYHLETEYSRNVADIGVNDAAANLFYCMAFVPQLHEIILDNRVSGVVSTYRRESVRRCSDDVSVLVISCNGVPHEVVVASDGEVSVAVMTDSENCVVPITEKSYRLFCDFPLIDTVPFPFPVVVNSSSFRVNEPRSCITLTDNPNSTDSAINKRLMQAAVSMYEVLLGHLVMCGCGKLFNAVSTPKVFSRSDISEQWVRENILRDVAKCVAGRVPFRDRHGEVFYAAQRLLNIPDLSNPETALELNELLYAISSAVVENDTLEWAGALASLESESFPVRYIKDVLNYTDFCENTARLQEILKKDVDVYSWLKALYLCAVKDEDIRNEINVGKYRLIPVQSGALRCVNTVYMERVKIDEYFKDVTEKIDRYLKADERLFLRSKLIDAALDTEGYEGIAQFDVGRLEQHLKYGTRTSLFNTEVHAVHRMMAACIADERAYNIYRAVNTRIPERYIPELKLCASVWDNTLIALEDDICSYFRMYDGRQLRFDDEESKLHTIDRINYYYEVKGRFDELAGRSGPILTEPLDGACSLHIIKANGYGYARIQDIDELMIGIYQRIVPDGIRLIDRRIKLDRSMNVEVMNELSAAALVSNVITAQLNEGALHTKPTEFQAACSLLLRWINQHEERAAKLFPAFSSKEKRMQLLTAEQAAVMSESLDVYEKLMKKYGVVSVEELEHKLREQSESSQGSDIPEEYYSLGYSEGADNFDEITKLVGDIGESLAVEILKEKYGSSAVVELHNSESYKQQGYDITVTISGQGTLYYEVKTRTASSVHRYRLSFSRSQASRLRDRDYRVLLVVIDGSRQLVEFRYFEDLFEGFAGGNFVRSDGYSIVTR